jgi:hypothetical protein
MIKQGPIFCRDLAIKIEDTSIAKGRNIILKSWV